MTGAAGCTSATLMWDEDFDVGMSAHAFLPDSLEIQVGETVEWVNDGSRSHTVTAYGAGIPEESAYFASGEFDDEETARAAWWAEDGGALYPGEQYSHTFEVPGRYWYFCIPHERGGMVGSIEVVE